MKILLFGKNGQVGWELCESLVPLGEVISLGSNDVDFTDTEAIRNCVKNYAPDIIVNAVAYTAVDKAELNQKDAYLINSKAVKVLAEEALRINAFLIHYSTDYVFNGQKKLPYTEEDLPDPLNIYGKTKLQGDLYIQQSGCRYIIFRVSWVFSSHGQNFAKTILKLAKSHKELKIINDQTGVPTSAKLIASITSLILYKVINDTSGKLFYGIYNLSAIGKVSWYDFAKTLIKQAKTLGASLNCDPENIIPITTQEYPLPAKRPMNSLLDISKLQQHFSLQIPSWELYSGRLVKDLIEKGYI